LWQTRKTREEEVKPEEKEKALGEPLIKEKGAQREGKTTVLRERKSSQLKPGWLWRKEPLWEKGRGGATGGSGRGKGKEKTRQGSGVFKSDGKGKNLGKVG